ncbi:protein kinase domain-containing protein [Candidatus Amarolinea aalborgensis]|uniref:protein kinase domain-containing protein n=1 Tax=Candidatus Amarolinea aalborgensis TaxID=2249329 RepID=UPI003BF9425E
MSPAETLIVVLVVVILLLFLSVLLVVLRLKRTARGPSKVTPATPIPSQLGSPVVAPAPITHYLLDVSGARFDKPIPLTPKGLTIGRAADNDVALIDEVMVSRHHAEIVQRGDQYVIRDLESANGTWINGKRISEHTLSLGNQIRLGNLELVFSNTPVWHSLLGSSPVVAQEPQARIAYTGVYFDEFLLEQLIGEGGMARVFRARAPDGSVVALKILHSADPYLIQKFRTEGNDIGPLLRGHPNIATVYDFRRSPNGELYIVEEYIDGMSLRQRLHAGPVSEADTIAIMQQVSSALGFAHSRNIVHRDVKPENILIAATNRVKVVDFGIARITSTLTITKGKLIGTPEYMSPEQAKGDEVLPPSDVYSLGVVIYEMLTGTVPFPMVSRPGADYWSGALHVLDQHLRATPVPLRNKVPTISPGLDMVAAKCLEKSSERRFANGIELASALGVTVSRMTPAKAPTNDTRATHSISVLRGLFTGRAWPLMNELIIGRNEINPDDVSLSRRHIRLEVTGGRIWLHDLSVNGTWVNKVRVSGKVELKPGDQIFISDCVLQINTLTAMRQSSP